MREERVPTAKIMAVAAANFIKSCATDFTLKPLKVFDTAYPMKIIPTSSAPASPASTPAKPNDFANSATERTLAIRKTWRMLSSRALPDTRYNTSPSSDIDPKKAYRPTRHRANS